MTLVRMLCLQSVIFLIVQSILKCPPEFSFNATINNDSKCYANLHVPVFKLDRCNYPAACKFLHNESIPVVIQSEIENGVLFEHYIYSPGSYIGLYIPCTKLRDGTSNNFQWVDGSPLTLNHLVVEKIGGMVMMQFDIRDGPRWTKIQTTEDAVLQTYSNQYFNDVLCAIKLNPSPCPDETYKYHVINGMGKCYKTITVPNKIDRCDLINVCRQLNPDAIPATIGSIEEREYMKTIVDPNEYVAIGVSIPCPLPYNVHKYKNVDGTPLPAPLEVTTGMWPDQFIGMLFHHKTDNFAEIDPNYHGQVLCSIPIWFSCPPGTYPDSNDGRVTMNTSCVQYVPYVPGSTPEATCANANSQYQPPSEIPCSLPHGIAHEKPHQLPYCSS